MDGSNMRGETAIEVSAEFLRQQTDAGVTVAEIAEAVGYSRKWVYAKMSEHGITPFDSRRIDRDLIRKMWRGGAPTEAIARSAFCSKGTVRRIAAKLGLPKRSKEDIVQSPRESVRAPTMAASPDLAPRLATEIAASSARVDAEIIMANGRYQALAAIEQEHHLRTGQALARWHVLRAK